MFVCLRSSWKEETEKRNKKKKIFKKHLRKQRGSEAEHGGGGKDGAEKVKSYVQHQNEVFLFNVGREGICWESCTLVSVKCNLR